MEFQGPRIAFLCLDGKSDEGEGHGNDFNREIWEIHSLRTGRVQD